MAVIKSETVLKMKNLRTKAVDIAVAQLHNMIFSWRNAKLSEIEGWLAYFTTGCWPYTGYNAYWKTSCLL